MKILKQKSDLIYKLIDQQISRQEYVQALIEQYHNSLEKEGSI